MTLARPAMSKLVFLASFQKEENIFADDVFLSLKKQKSKKVILPKGEKKKELFISFVVKKRHFNPRTQSPAAKRSLLTQ